MGIKIGNNNKIKNSNIADGNTINFNSEDKSFSNKHPILIGIFVSIVSALILMIPFWDKVSEFIKKLF
ncbi:MULTISPECIES: hypothetical protein [Clostridium]|uniref:hypothetical protein n=1 Tax=Clostridium TaxID=1485 RepID=UPI000C089FE8|nr:MULTISPECIES: hypothetical protein [Clostridium]MDB2108455.1 hypothetical protein [Clostridium paraputrificum]MDB2115322.1 hypothetical protein [Clostridium paraputrificum]MDU4726641.1 hypothetical protein [Clostridium sp.]